MSYLTKSLICLVLLILNTVAWGNYYRYYDANGRQSITTSVTPNHVRYGYEVLNNQMYVIQRVPASAQVSQQQLQQKQQHQEELQRLRSAYGSSGAAIRKRDEILKKLTDQLAFQNKQYQALLKTNQNLLAQQNNFTRQGKTVPVTLSQEILQNNRALQNTSALIRTLQQQIAQTTASYDQAIQRLKANGL